MLEDLPGTQLSRNQNYCDLCNNNMVIYEVVAWFGSFREYMHSSRVDARTEQTLKHMTLRLNFYLENLFPIFFVSCY